MKPFFQLPKHKVFDYKPWFYDPDKEYIKQRRKELGIDSEVEKLAGTGGMLRSGAMRALHDSYKPRREDGSRQRFVRRGLIALILCILIYTYLDGSLQKLIAIITGTH